MSPAEIWMLASFIVAFVAAVLFLLEVPPTVNRVAHAALAGALGCMAVSFFIAFP
jgi:hypothetical protein